MNIMISLFALNVMKTITLLVKVVMKYYILITIKKMESVMSAIGKTTSLVKTVMKSITKIITMEIIYVRTVIQNGIHTVKIVVLI